MYGGHYVSEHVLLCLCSYFGVLGSLVKVTVSLLGN